MMNVFVPEIDVLVSCFHDVHKLVIVFYCGFRMYSTQKETGELSVVVGLLMLASRIDVRTRLVGNDQSNQLKIGVLEV